MSTRICFDHRNSGYFFMPPTTGIAGYSPSSQASDSPFSYQNLTTEQLLASGDSFDLKLIPARGAIGCTLGRP
jgi:hypothetical protein